MARVLKVIEVLSESATSYEEAIATAVEETSKSVRHIRSAYVNEQSVTVKDGKVVYEAQEDSKRGDLGPSPFATDPLVTHEILQALYQGLGMDGR